MSQYRDKNSLPLVTAVPRSGGSHYAMCAGMPGPVLLSETACPLPLKVPVPCPAAACR